MASNNHANDSFLDALPRDYRDKMLQKCGTRHYKRRQQIVRARDRDHDVYLIRVGKVRVTLFSRDGKEVSFGDLGPGENFGELAAIDGAPRSADVIALQNTTITIIPRRVFEQMLLEQPAACRKILARLSLLVRRLCERVFEYSTLGVNNRLHAELLRLAKQHLDLDGVARINNPPTHAELANRISCHREAVSREMRELAKRKLVQKQNRRLIIADYRRLEDLVESLHHHNLAGK